MNEQLQIPFFICFMIIAFTVIIIGTNTNWNFDIERAITNYKIQVEKEKMEHNHFIKLYEQSKTTTDCQVLKEIRLEILTSDSMRYEYLKTDIKEMAKERMEILCP